MQKKYRTNFVALALAAILLAIGFYCQEDVKVYYEANLQREEFAEQVADSIKSGVPIDHMRIEEEEARLNEVIQALAENTDLGRLFAKNDLTEEGRNDNELIFCSFGVLMIFVGGVIILNVFRLVIDIFYTIPKRIRAASKARKANSNYDDEDDDSDDQDFD